MPIELQSDMILGAYWKAVREHMLREVVPRKLGDWHVILRPKTRADEDFTKDPARYNLTTQRAKEIERESCTIDVDEPRRTITFSFPRPERWETSYPADDLASELIEDVELLAEPPPQ